MFNTYRDFRRHWGDDPLTASYNNLQLVGSLPNNTLQCEVKRWRQQHSIRQIEWIAAGIALSGETPADPGEFLDPQKFFALGLVGIPR